MAVFDLNLAGSKVILGYSLLQKNPTLRILSYRWE